MAEAASSPSAIGDRRARSLAGARRRSVRITILRRFLLAAMAALGANVLIQLALSGASERGQGAVIAPAGPNERITNPRFSGRDADGSPFLVTADSAIRRSGGVAGLADLERPTLDYAFLASGDSSEVLSRAGVFDDAEQTLELREDVRLQTRSGYAFQTEAALIRLRDGVVSGDAPVRGQATWGALRAQSFEVREDGRRIILTGDVRTRIEMDQDQEPQP
jgi:lipopolysaccharide export system protein LptC